MGQRILITGGSGLLALNLAQAVSEQCSVTLGLRKRQVDVSAAKTPPIDIESVDSLARSIEETATLVVIHTAGLTSVDRCESEPLKFDTCSIGGRFDDAGFGEQVWRQHKAAHAH